MNGTEKKGRNCLAKNQLCAYFSKALFGGQRFTITIPPTLYFSFSSPTIALVLPWRRTTPPLFIRTRTFNLNEFIAVAATIFFFAQKLCVYLPLQLLNDVDDDD